MRENIISVQKWTRSHPPTEHTLQEMMRHEGLKPYRWSNNPGDYYDAHAHNYHKVIYVVSGSITMGFPVEGEPTTLHAGDRLDLPPGVLHNAAVGPQGVVCLEAHK
jgi:quercetin dioxygenase-like cupin family protein